MWYNHSSSRSFTLLRIFICVDARFLILPRLPKDFLHTSHVYQHSSLCILRCFLRLLWQLQDLLCTVHMNGRSPLCMRRCLFRLLWQLNVFLPHKRMDVLHSVHVDACWDCSENQKDSYAHHKALSNITAAAMTLSVMLTNTTCMWQTHNLYTI